MSSTIVALIVSLVFVVILVSGFFVGFWRGLKKSTANLVISIVGAIIAFFITPVVTNAIMGINIEYNGQTTSLGQMVVIAIKENPDIANIINNNPNLEAFFANLPSAVANTIVFILLTIAIEIVIYIIYRIFACFFFKTKEGEKKHRLFGGLVGLAKTFVITLFAFMPLAGLIGVLNTYTYSDTYIIESVATYSEEQVDNGDKSGENGILGEYVPDQVVQVIRGFEDNMLTKICGIFGLDNATFDYLSKFQIENENIYIRQELEDYYKIADFALQVSKEDNLKFSNIDYDKVEISINNVVDNGLFKTVVCDLVADILVNYEKYPFISDNQSFQEYSDVINEIGKNLALHEDEEKGYQIYFTNDINQIFATFKTLGQNGIIDQIISLEDKSIENVLNVLTNEQNSEKFEQSINSLLKVNLIRDGIEPIVQRGVDEILEGSDKIDVDTSSWTEQDWTDLSSSLVNVVNDYSKISNQIDLNTLLSDATILLDKQANYNINEILTSTGSLIDEVRSIKLFKNAQGQSIFDKYLTDNNISLPQETIYDSLGQTVEIKNYKQMFEFIAPSVTELRDSNLYDIISSSGDSTTMMTNLASLLSIEGNDDLLSKILLPLQQIEPIKSIINENLSSLSNDIVDFSNLTTYQDWKDDYKYITEMIISLNEKSVDNQTYLEIALSGDIDKLLNNLTDEDVDVILKPILYAKSTNVFKQNLINNVKEVLDNLTSPAMSNIDISSITLKEGEKEDQTQEICNVFKNFIKLNKIYQDGNTLKDLDKTVLANLFTSMQQNAYRTENSEEGLQEIGLFNGAFINLMSKLKNTYADAIEFIESQEGYENYFDENNYKNIDFANVFELIKQYEQAQA